MRLFIAVLTVTILSACTNTKTSCPLNNEYGYCASVGETAKAAVNGGGSQENVLEGKKGNASSGNDSQIRARRIAARHPLYSPGPGQGLSGPIYKPAKPRRLWVAPWTDANGVLHGGEYVYFLAPGHWRYGPLKAPGAASGVMGPVSPGDLGFTPGKKPDKAKTPNHIQKPDRSLSSNAKLKSGNPFPMKKGN